MANANRPTGLSPIRNVFSQEYNGGGNIYAVPAAYATALYIGDPVISVAAGGNPGGVKYVALAAATGPILGVIVGIGRDAGTYSNPGNTDITYRPAAAQSTDWYCLVVDDPNAEFEVQEVGTGTPLTAADIGLNTNLVLGAGNGYVSGWMLDNATEAVGATLQCRILGLVQRLDNAVGQYAKWRVKINNHELNSGTGTVGL